MTNGKRVKANEDCPRQKRREALKARKKFGSRAIIFWVKRIDT
jgi:hypothetical protein